MIISYATLAFYTLVLASSALSTAFGVGSFVLIPIFILYFDAKESVAIISLYFIFQNIAKLLFFWRFVDWGISKQLLIYALPGALLGSALLLQINIIIFQKILGAAILLYVAANILKSKKITPSPPKKYFYISILSFLYGFSSGVIGSGNAVKGPLLTSAGLTKEIYIATYAATSILLNIPKILIYGYGGLINTSVAFHSIPLLAASILGTYFGKKFITKVSESKFNLVVNIFFILSAITLIW